MFEQTFTISSSPHAHSKNNTGVIMRDVCIALLPALIWSIVSFGLRALTLTAVSVLSCLVFEWGYRKLLHKDNTLADWSAVVTGMLLAFVCPVTLPTWAMVIGAFFAIVVTKQLFGGIGLNFVNPALIGRAFVMFAWPTLMSGVWLTNGTRISVLPETLDGMTSATPMQALHAGTLPSESLLDVFLGRVGGSMGEISALLLLLGAAYLVVRKVITLRIPVVYLLSVAVLTFVFPLGGVPRLEWMLYQLFSGGLMLGALFMATDYTTSPVTHGGQIAYAVGCGVLTVLIRYFGSYVEGVSFAILLMNCCVGFFDRIGMPRQFGTKKGGARK